MTRLFMEVEYPGITQAQCLAMHEDEEYQNTIAAYANAHRQVLARRTGKPFLRTARFDCERRVDTRWQRMLGAATPHIAYLEDSVYSSPAGGTWAIRIAEPGLAREHVSMAGVVQFLPTQRGVVRRVDGEITCDYPLIGAAIERHIRDTVLQSLQRAASYTGKWLHDHPGRYSHVGTQPAARGPRVISESAA